ncbi:TPA: hypothetical protein UM343_002356 [Stenotrophomonas maltophilia]|nr:hypothetical protein [Stenotrophomonas maltophilia]
MERMTAGNVWAICLSGFVLGALASWGVFYEYRCAPGVEKLNVSAWAQVVVAAVVGAAAVYVPKQIANSERRRRSEVFVRLLDMVIQSTYSLAICLVDEAPRLSLIKELLHDIEMQSKALESYPISEVPSAALLMHRAEAKAHADGLSALTERLLPDIETYKHLFYDQIEAVNVYKGSIEQLIHSLENDRS